MRYAWGSACQDALRSDFRLPGGFECPPGNPKHRIIADGVEIDHQAILIDFVDEEARWYRTIRPDLTGPTETELVRVWVACENSLQVILASPA